jgi:uncharacterized peroxidase-related enzyme
MFIDSDAPMSDELSSYYADVAAGWGYLPNFARAFAWHPEIARAWSGLGGAISNAMDRRRYELVTIGAARALRSTYCTLAHARFLRDDCGDAATVERIAGTDSRPFDALDAALMEFGAKVARDASAITADDVDELRRLGLDEREISEVAFAAAARCFFAKAMDALGVQADAQLADEFEPEVRAAFVVGRPVAPGT